MYSNERERKQGRIERDEQARMNKEKYKGKKKRDREYRQRKRDQERLSRHPDPLALLADTVTQEIMLRDADNDNAILLPSIMAIVGEKDRLKCMPSRGAYLDGARRRRWI
jgi:hypothetical protein